MLPSVLWEMVCLMAYFKINLLILTYKCSNMSTTVAQAPGSDFTGASLAVLKGAKELLTHKFLFSTVFRCQI